MGQVPPVLPSVTRTCSLLMLNVTPASSVTSGSQNVTLQPFAAASSYSDWYPGRMATCQEAGRANQGTELMAQPEELHVKHACQSSTGGLLGAHAAGRIAASAWWSETTHSEAAVPPFGTLRVLTLPAFCHCQRHVYTHMHGPA
jgi:hypothetical protein